MKIIAAIAAAISLAASFAATASAQNEPASDAKVWGGLVFGSDAATGRPSGVITEAIDFAGISERLAKVFPWQDYTLIGDHTQDVFREYESWVVPSKDLFLKMDSKGRDKDGNLQLHIQLWQDKTVLVKTDAVLKSDSPLFIGGPHWRDGQLIFVVILANGDADS